MKVRVISAIVGLVILAVVLTFFETIVLNIAVSVVGVMAVFEFFQATGILRNRLMSGVCFLVSAVIPFLKVEVIRERLTYFLLPYMFVLFVILLITHKITKIEQMSMAFMFSLALPLALSSAIYLRDGNGFAGGIFYIVLALGGAWLSDTGAYFVGRKYGKTKLAPVISPHKTVEGAVGGILTCTVSYGLIALIYAQICKSSGLQVNIHYFYIVLVAPVVSLISMLGDLSASVIKRQYKVKDFGNIMPGHGGVLDRFDSVFFVAPFIYILSVVLPVITPAK